MATATTTPETATTGEARPRPYRITVPLYERMIASGVFTEKEPVFLWEGELVEKRTKGPDHNHAVADLAAALIRVVPEGWHVRPEASLVVGEDKVPEPDFTVARGRTRDYPGRNVAAADVALVAEVADSSLPFDSGSVLRAFAEAGIPVYWLVNLPERTIDVYSSPRKKVEAGCPRYDVCCRYGLGDDVPVVLDGREVGRVAVRNVLP